MTKRKEREINGIARIRSDIRAIKTERLYCMSE